jgi:hypothetical protein
MFRRVAVSFLAGVAGGAAVQLWIAVLVARHMERQISGSADAWASVAAEIVAR